LVSCEGELICSACKSRYEVRGNIPCFTNLPYWGEVPPEEMRKINRFAKEKGWKEVLEERLEPKNPVLYEYVAGKRRANWHLLLPLTSESRVLDLGAGWGSISFLLAPKCKEVVAVEGIYERAEFCEIKRTQEGIQNLQVIVADVTELPLPKGYFDLIILNGILEWVGLFGKEDPLAMQRKFLRNLWELLGPGGYVYIGVENRYQYNSFFGGRDHTGLQFTNLMPRRIANLYCKFSMQNSPRTYNRLASYRVYTHSYWDYKNLLHASGFSNVEIFAVLPGYNNPSILLPLDNSNILSYYLTCLRLFATFLGKFLGYWARILVKLGLAKLLVPDFSIIAQKEGLNDT